MSEMPKIRTTTPGDGWVPGCFTDNRNKFPREELAKYQGKYVAWSLDGTSIIGSADSEAELWSKMDAQGIGSSFYVGDWIEEFDSLRWV